MRTIKASATTVTDLRIIIGNVRYYLRVYPDGTIDVFGSDGPRLIALGAVGLDGIAAGTALEARLGRFLADNKGECASE